MMKNKDENVIPDGPFKGKKIEFAATHGVDTLSVITEDFMLRIFELEKEC